MRLACVAVLLIGLAACGQVSDLKPAHGGSLPPKPYGAAERPDANRLLEVPTQAQPGRSVELRKRSEEREDDPFDLPPQE